MINAITISGRVTSELSERKTATGLPVSSFKLAHCDPESSKILYIEVETWGREAQRLSSFVSEGCDVVIYGRLSQDRWQSRGKQMSKHKVTANKVILVNKDR